MKKILITGGSGFIGGYVYRYFHECGYNVLNYDIKGEQTDDTFIKGSILDFDLVRRAVEEADVIFHFAGFSNINLVKTHPKECIELNITGTANFLEAIRLKGNGRFIFASSVYVHNTNGHFYTTSKLASELICNNYLALYEIPVTILRLGTVYGENSRHDDVVSIFVKKACLGEPIVIHGTGRQKRHFIHGEDIARACQQIVDKDITNRTLILAGKNEVTINELADIVKKNINKDVFIKRLERTGREDDYQGDVSDTNLRETFKVLGWEPEIDIIEGVNRLIKYFKERG